MREYEMIVRVRVEEDSDFDTWGPLAIVENIDRTVGETVVSLEVREIASQ